MLKDLLALAHSKLNISDVIIMKLQKHSYKTNQQGFAHILAFILAVIVIGVIAFIGLKLLKGSQAQATCVQQSNLVNTCGPLLGTYARDYPQVSSGLKSQVLYQEQRIGRQGAIVRGGYHVNDGTALSADELYFANRPGTTLMIDWKPNSGNWAAAGGSNAAVNARIGRMADSLKSVGNKVMLVIAHEPENDVSSDPNCPHTASPGSSGTPAQYVAMWHNVRQIFDQHGVTNVVYVLDYMGYNQLNCYVNDLYPGNSYVDWIMNDIYGNGAHRTYQTAVGPFYQYLTQNSTAAHNYLSKPWGQGEFSIHQEPGASGSQLVSRAQTYAYYDSVKASVDQNLYPNMKAYIIFDSLNGKPDNRIEYDNNGVWDPTELQHYKAFATDAKLVDASKRLIDNSAPSISLTAPANNSQVHGTVRISANARDNVGVTAVVLRVDDNYVATSSNSTSPYTVTLDTRQFSNGTHSYYLRAWDAANNHSDSAHITIKVQN
jgi:hypothetical protein